MAKVVDVAKVVYSGLRDTTSGARLKEIIKVLKKNDVHKGVSPEELVHIMEDLGPTFIKLGQILSSRSDVLPQKYCNALKSLRSNTTPEPFEVIERRLKRVYGDAYDDIFLSIDEHPLGSASIAQVHKAVLRKNNECVAVKIQRHHVKEDMLRDIALLRRAMDLIDLSGAKLFTYVDLGAVVDEFEETVREEIDFCAELNNIERFAFNNRNRDGISCPHTYPEYSNETVLVMEFIKGFSLNEAEKLDTSPYDSKELGSRLAASYMRHMVEDGFFHVDPHPANIVIRTIVPDVVLEDSADKPIELTAAQDGAARLVEDELTLYPKGCKAELVYIDCGMMGELTTIERRQFFAMMNAMIERDGHTLTDIFLEWGRPQETGGLKLNYGKLVQDLTNLVNRYCVVDAVDIDIASLLNDIMEVLDTAHIVMPRSFVTLVRGLATLQGTLLAICPEISIWGVTREYLEGFMCRSFDPVRFSEDAWVRSRKALEASLEIPGHIAHVLDMVEKGRVNIGLDLAEAEQPMSKLGKISDRLSLSIITAGLFVGSSLIYVTGMQPQLFGIPVIGFCGFVGAAILSLYIIWQIRKGL